MAATYSFKVSKENKGFDFNGKHFGPGDEYGPVDACNMIQFLNASKAANPDAGINEQSATVSQLEEECPVTPNNSTPQPGSGPAPVETNPVITGGDNAQNQGAPQPPTAGIVQQAGGGAGSTGPGDAPTEEPLRPPNGKPSLSHGGDQPQQQTNAGDPVYLFQGAFSLQEKDLEIPNTILPLSLVRLYQSGAATYGPFGWNWDHNYNLYLRELSNGDIAMWRNLHENVFKFDGANFEPPRGVFEKLSRVPGIAQAFEIITDGGTMMRFERPAGWSDGERIPLFEIKDRHANKLVFSYRTDDKLAEVRDDDGRFLKFDYDKCGLLVAVSDHAGRKYEYQHDEQTMQLTCVKTPATSDHPNGITRVYHYEQPFALPELRHNILRVEDSQGNVYLENKYEADPAAWQYARLTDQLYGGFLYQFRYTQLQWVPANPVYINIPALSVEVMNPDLGLETYTFNYRGDLLDRRYRLNKDRSFRVVAWQYTFDEQGNLSITTNPDGSQEINTFDFENPDPRMRGKLLKKELTAASGFPSPSRIIWQAKYEPVYQLVMEEKNELGAVTKYKYDFDLNPGTPVNSGKLMEVIHPVVTLPGGSTQNSVTKFEYNNQGQVRATIIPIGTRLKTVYGTAGVEKSRPVKKILDAGGLNIENRISYDAFGYEAELTDGNRNSTFTVVNALGLLEKTILAPVKGIEAQYRLHYDTDRRLIAAERPKGAYADGLLSGDAIVDQFERDVMGYPIRHILSSNTAEARTQRVSPDFRGLPVETINPDGSKIKRIYDERGLLIQDAVIGPDGSRLTSKKSYDRRGKLREETNPFGSVTRYEYDGFARLAKISLPNNTQIKYHWLKGDLLGSEEVIGEDGFGTTRQLSMKVYTYDKKGRKITETIKSFRDNPSTATNVTSIYFFDPSDRIVKVVDSRGGVTTFQYDGLGRLKISKDAMGNEQHNAYDSAGNLIQTDSHHKEPNGSTSVLTRKYAYDQRNRKIETIEPDGAAFTQIYDDRNLVIGQIDQAGVRVETTYDSFHYRIRETHDIGGLSITHQWQLDSMSRVTAYIDPAGQVSKYHLDGVGRNFKTEYPNGFSSTKVFNSAGQIGEEILGSGVKFEYNYDVANRLASIKNSAAPAPLQALQPHEFKYDGYDRVVSAKIGLIEVVRKYDSRGRLTLEKTLGSEMACLYDDNAGTVEKIWPDGRTEKYSHNLNGILTAMEETVNGTLGSGTPLIASLKPSGSNYFGEAAYPGGLKIANRYDERKRLVEWAVSTPAGLNETINYRYDKANRIQVEAIFGQKSKTSYFEFDHQSRLTLAKDGFAAVVPNAFTQSEHDSAINSVKAAAAGAAHAEAFAYTPADERIEYAETGSAVQTYTYLAGHRIQNDGVNNYTHHTGGTLLSDGQFTYEVDALGRVDTIKSGINIICQITYDAFGRPSIIKEVGKPEKSFNYLGGYVEQENENGTPSRQISMHPITGVPIAYHTALGTLYPLFDNRFNLIGLADAGGVLLESYRYKSFGDPEIFDSTGNQLSASAIGIEPSFGGQRFLSSTGLYLSRRRLMNPQNGVFLSADPNGYADSPSLYAYASQNPVDKIDPTGEIAPIIAVFVIGGAMLGAGYCIYDAYYHPEKYEGVAGVWKPLAGTFGGAAIGGASILGGEVVLGSGGVGIFATGGGATTLTAAQTFALYGTANVVGGGIGRVGFNYMFPEYVDPVSGETITTDFVMGGGLPVAGAAVRELATPLVSGAEQIFNRSIGGNWRAFGNISKLLANPRIQYDLGDIFWNPKSFQNVSRQYWRVSRGADGKALHHLWFQNQSKWIPQGLRNAGFNLIEIPASLNTWMGGRLGRELAFRGIATGILAGTGLGSYKGASGLLNWLNGDESRQSTMRTTNAEKHPNELTSSK